MFKNKICQAYLYIKYLNKTNFNLYKNTKITSPLLLQNLYIHSGNNLVKKNNNYLFIARSIKFNIFFKKPLVRPTKKIKK